jgi:hypothetical protein
MTTPIEKAERDLDNLEEQRENLFSRAKRLGQERDQIAIAALTAGDKKAKARLSEINNEDIGLTANIASVEAALTVARANLLSAQHVEAIAKEREKASEIVGLNAQLKEQLEDADEAFAGAIESVLIARKLLQKIHALAPNLGPTDQLFRVNVVTAIKTVLQGFGEDSDKPGLPSNYISDFEFSRLAPLQKKQFRDLAEGWCRQIENQIAQLLPPRKDAA